MRVFKLFLITSIFGIFLTLALPASADDVLDTAEEAVSLYKAGKYSEAAGSFEYAGQLARKMRSGELSDYLPNALDGWQAQEVEQQAIGGMFGGGTSAERTYTKGNASITVTIMTDSPMIQGVVMILQNPMMMGGAGKIVKVNNLKAYLDFDSSNNSGELQLVVANQHLVQLRGSNITTEDILAYAKGVNYDGLEKK